MLKYSWFAALSTLAFAVASAPAAVAATPPGNPAPATQTQGQPRGGQPTKPPVAPAKPGARVGKPPGVAVGDLNGDGRPDAVVKPASTSAVNAGTTGQRSLHAEKNQDIEVENDETHVASKISRAAATQAVNGMEPGSSATGNPQQSANPPVK